MEKLTEQTLKALLAQAGLEPKEGDLELGVLKQDFVNRTIADKT